MNLHAVDWIVVGLYVVVALGIGFAFAKRASSNVDEYFLSGRTLPWWLAGTSMIATSFAADTPLLVSGWVRDSGIWKNWVWWCYAISGTLQVFLFARWWRRGGVMTKAELAELRYGGTGAKALRGLLGFIHSAITNTWVLCWVLLAAAKISEVLFDVDKVLALSLCCVVALSYSLMAGFWGVVLTDFIQFIMAMVGAVALAILSWQAVGGNPAVQAAVADGRIPLERLQLLPQPDAGGAFWTTSIAAIFVYLGVSWWAVENVDGSGIAVQRISASRDERQGILATLWFNVGHYALRPWCWIAVGIASLVVLPSSELASPVQGIVQSIQRDRIVIAADGGDVEVALAVGEQSDWLHVPEVGRGDRVEAGEVVGRTDPERAYVVMMTRYLPIGFLGLVFASLIAAFMSTIDTHVNLATSFFINDIYRRFVRKDAPARHYINVARIASVIVLALAGVLAWRASSIRTLFEVFLAFLGGVGPIYVLRWFWWRIRAWTEITAMLASAGATLFLTLSGVTWSLGPLSWNEPPGLLIGVVSFSLACAGIELLVGRRPDPASLVEFYRRIRPLGAWGPVAALAPDVRPSMRLGSALRGSLGGILLVYGLTFSIGFFLLDRGTALAIASVGAALGLVILWGPLRALDGAAVEVDESGD